MKYSVLIVLLTLISCTNRKIIETKPDPIPVKIQTCKNGVPAVLKKIKLDGCNWIIELESGEKLEPQNINQFLSETDYNSSKQFKIKVEYYETKSASICMVGKTIAITCIKLQ
jgi:hypothetical protein